MLLARRDNVYYLMHSLRNLEIERDRTTMKERERERARIRMSSSVKFEAKNTITVLLLDS